MVQQVRHDVRETYRELTLASRQAWQNATARIPGGVSSNVRFFPPYPIFMDRASGSKVYDVDGREYIDYCLAFGPLIAGHGHPRLMQAIRAELDRAGTVIFGASSPLELALAERLSRLLPSAEMVRFTNSGTEATMHAIRLARGATGRTRVVKFEGHYHGGHDAVLIGLDASTPARAANDGIPATILDATLVLPFNDVSALREQLEAAKDVAAVIVEPVARGAICAEVAFLRELRAITERNGSVLIFDEVVAWPRVSLAGAQGWLGVTPDLTALGKAIGGGLPMGAVVGRRDLMSLFAPKKARFEPAKAGPHPINGAGFNTNAVGAGFNKDAVGAGFSRLGDQYVFHGGTYNGTTIALAAGLALLDLLEEPGVYDGLIRMGERMRAELRDLFARRGVGAQVIGHGAAFDFYFTDQPIRSLRDVWNSDLTRREELDYHLFEQGIYNSPLHRFHLSLAHTDDDLSRTLDAIDRAL
jgi:glutamate-1-semialdehyde 2,1-aminomutase